MKVMIFHFILNPKSGKKTRDLGFEDAIKNAESAKKEAIISAKEEIFQQLISIFPNSNIFVETDMLGACRGSCINNEGIVGILGTGSNSCVYDGQNIVANVSPLGFILGDEGSGACLGKLMVGDLLKNQMTPELKEKFLA